MSYKEAREHVRNRIIALSQYNKQENAYWRYHGKDPQNRPQVAKEPEAPESLKLDPLFRTTAYHTVYNYLKGKQNCHKFKDPNAWEAHCVNRDIQALIEYLKEEFDCEFPVRHAQAV